MRTVYALGAISFFALVALPLGISSILEDQQKSEISSAAPRPKRGEQCDAIPKDGPSPSWLLKRQSFDGKVQYIVDGDGICVGDGSDSSKWIEVRLADFYAPELNEPGGRDAKAILTSISFHEYVRCTPVKEGRARSYDRVNAVCYLGTVSLGDAMRRAGVQEGGRAYKSPGAASTR